MFMQRLVQRTFNGVIVVAILCCRAAIAQDEAVASRVAGPVVETNRERIGTVLGRTVYRDQLGDGKPTAESVVARVIAPAVAAYQREHDAEIRLTMDELRAASQVETTFRREKPEDVWKSWNEMADERRRTRADRLAQGREMLEKKDIPAEERFVAESALRYVELDAEIPNASYLGWMYERLKFEQLLYRKFGGGRVLLQQLGPEAFDARRKLLLSLEASKKFEFFDPALREIAFSYWTRTDHPAMTGAVDRYDSSQLEFPWLKNRRENP